MVNSSHEGVCALMLTFHIRAQTAVANQLMVVDAGGVFTFRAHPSPFHPHCQQNEATDITIAIHSEDNRTLKQATEPECILNPLAYSIMYKTVWWKNRLPCINKIYLKCCVGNKEAQIRQKYTHTQRAL